MLSYIERVPTPKVDAPELSDCPYGHRLSRVAGRIGIFYYVGNIVYDIDGISTKPTSVRESAKPTLFFLLTVSLIEKGQKRDGQTACGNQQTDYPHEYHNNIRSSHITHLPSYVGPIPQASRLGRMPPCQWVLS